MPQLLDFQSFLPSEKPGRVVAPGEFVFAAAGLDHGHIYGMCGGLLDAGAELRYVYDPDPAKVEAFVRTYPGTKAVCCLDAILDQPEVRLVAGAAVPADRGPLGCRVLRAGKDYFTDKTPFTTLAQLEEARRTVAETARTYAVYYSERLHVESALFAGRLVDAGVIGKVVQVLGLGPHRHGPPGSRPDWFYRKARYGGILCDIGSHQCEQFLAYTGSTDGTVTDARVANYAHPEQPEFEDFGEANLVGTSGASFYYRVDWFTPDGLGTWGDGRTIIVGTTGYIELRKYIDVARDRRGNHVFLVTQAGEQYTNVSGQVGFPYFGALIRDCLDRTHTAAAQEHVFKAAELCLRCQELADRRRTADRA